MVSWALNLIKYFIVNFGNGCILGGLFSLLLNNRFCRSYQGSFLSSCFKGPKIVVIGGGTGLQPLRGRATTIYAIVSVADDGGSSGR